MLTNSPKCRQSFCFRGINLNIRQQFCYHFWNLLRIHVVHWSGIEERQGQSQLGYPYLLKQIATSHVESHTARIGLCNGVRSLTVSCICELILAQLIVSLPRKFEPELQASSFTAKEPRIVDNVSNEAQALPQGFTVTAVYFVH